MSAAEELSTPGPVFDLAPAGIPVRGGRMNLARLRTMVPVGKWLDVVVGFGTVCWVGSPGLVHPDLGRLAYRSQTRVDGRGRLALDRRVRTWLAVADVNAFDAVALSSTLMLVAGVVLVVESRDADPVDESNSDEAPVAV